MRLEKAQKLIDDNKVIHLMETKNASYFEVKSNDIHSVILNKIENRWLCDCHWATMRTIPDKEQWGYCSHILACKIFRGDKNVESEIGSIAT